MRTIYIILYTHSVNGLTEADFQSAASYDAIPVEYSPKWLKENPVTTKQALEATCDLK